MVVHKVWQKGCQLHASNTLGIPIIILLSAIKMCSHWDDNVLCM